MAADRDLKPRTRELYRNLLDDVILPDLGGERLDRITPALVREWYARLDPERATRRAHAYGLLRTVLGSAVTDDILTANPCKVPGGSHAPKQHTTKIASLDELDTIVKAMPERYRAMVLLAAWCGLRFGELTELRRSDLDMAEGVVHVRRGVVRAGGEVIVGTPKSSAGIRTVSIPPHVRPAVADAPAEARRQGPRLAGVPGPQRLPHGPQRAVPGLVSGAGEGGPPRPPLPRPAAHRA